MNAFRFFSLALTYCLLISCSGSAEEPEAVRVEAANHLLIYRAPDFSNARVHVKSVLLANQETGQMELRMNVLNKLGVPLKFDYLQAQLASKGAARATPDYTEAFLPEIEAGEQAHYELDYSSAIHSKEVFHQIEYRGDLNPLYTLPLDFLGFPNKKISFEANPDAYASYLEGYGKEQTIRVFNLREKEGWEQAQTNCSSTTRSAVSWKQGEWNIGGVVGKTWVYRLGDSLYIHNRIANQSKTNLLIDPQGFEYCLGKAGNPCQKANSYQVVLATRQNPRGAGFVIQKSERFQVNYALPASPELLQVRVVDLGLRTLPDLKAIPCQEAPFHFAQSGIGVLSSKSSSK